MQSDGILAKARDFKHAEACALPSCFSSQRVHDPIPPLAEILTFEERSSNEHVVSDI